MSPAPRNPSSTPFMVATRQSPPSRPGRRRPLERSQVQQSRSNQAMEVGVLCRSAARLSSPSFCLLLIIFKKWRTIRERERRPSSRATQHFTTLQQLQCAEEEGGERQQQDRTGAPPRHHRTRAHISRPCFAFKSAACNF